MKRISHDIPFALIQLLAAILLYLGITSDRFIAEWGGTMIIVFAMNIVVFVGFRYLYEGV